MLRLGLVYRCWPLPGTPADLSPAILAAVIARTDVLLERVQRPKETSDG